VYSKISNHIAYNFISSEAQELRNLKNNNKINPNLLFFICGWHLILYFIEYSNISKNLLNYLFAHEAAF